MLHITERPVYQEIRAQFDKYVGKDLIQSRYEIREMFWYISDEDFRAAYHHWYNN